MLIVIGLVGILVSAGLVVINPAQQFKKSRDSERKSELKQIQAALELYRSDQGSYPTPVSNAVSNCPSASPVSLLELPCGTSPTTYMQTVPKEPKFTSVNNGNYYYCTDTAAPCSATSGGYVLYACLENSSETVAGEVVSSSPLNCGTSVIRYLKVLNP